MLRGVEAFCTVCNARRTPFASNILNLAGKPARIGGIAARIFGWGAMIVGLLLALTVGLIAQAVVSLFVATTWIGLAFGLPIALVALLLGLGGIFGGKKLARVGEASLEKAQLETIRGLVRHHGDVLRPSIVARALNVSEQEADSILTALARKPDENVSIDVDDDGNILYLFGSSDAIRWRIRAERARITDTEREELEAELEQAEAEAEHAERARRERR